MFLLLGDSNVRGSKISKSQSDRGLGAAAEAPQRTRTAYPRQNPKRSTC